eukprot:gene12941-8797_t
MLGGKHYQKKQNKKQSKKESKKERSAAQAASASSHAAAAAVKSQKSHNASTLKGPVVSYAAVGAERGARDAANDRRGVPFRNAKEEASGRGGRGGRGAGGRGAGAPGAAEANTRSTIKLSLASSQAQRRRVLRQKGGEDLLSHFRERLSASTFRLLNEQLYNSPNAYATQLLRDEGTFREYHTGYRQQLVQWPVNPNEFIAQALLQDRRGKFHSASDVPGNGGKLGGQSSSGSAIPANWVVADMGCGEAQIAATLKPKGYTVHSFDLCALNEHVTVADAVDVPLESNSVDVCIFSLSLMATDYERSLFEAFRILKPHRLLKIVEVRSRMPFPARFAEMVASIGFTTEFQDVVGDYFVAFDFFKRDGAKEPRTTALAHPPGEVLLPSMYKKR